MRRGTALAVFPLLLGSGCSDVLGLDFDGYRPRESSTVSGGGSGGAGAGTSSHGASATGGSPGCLPTQQACDGACFDEDDPAHCGGCGHDCFGGTCEEGSCGPVVVASGQVGASGIVRAADAVFWTNGAGEIVRMNLTGGAASPIHTDAPGDGIFHLATDGTSLFYTATSAGEVRRVEADGSAPGIVKFGVNSPGPLAVGGTWVYWRKDIMGDGDLHRAPKDGTTDPTELNTLAHYGGVAADASNAYFTLAASGGVVSARSHGGGSNSTIADEQDQPWAVRVSGAFVYWTNVGSGEVRRVPTTGGAIEDLASGQDSPRALYVDGQRAFWINAGDGSIATVPVTGGTTVVLASRQAGPRDITGDDASIWWTNGDSGEVVRLAKPLDR